MEEFLSELVERMGRVERRKWASIYIRGLLLEGQRKSIEPMASRLPGADVQALRQFVSQSPWPEQPVQEALAFKLLERLKPEVWIVDETSFPKAGNHSVGVERQYCGALGKIANCQVAVSLHLSHEQFSCPIFWSLHLPKSWSEDQERRQEAKVPEKVSYQSKQEQALALLEKARQAQLPLLPVLADSFYGNTFEFRRQLRQWQWPYAVEVEPETVAWQTEPSLKVTKQPAATGRPRLLPPQEEIAQALSLKAIAQSWPKSAWKKLSWKEGSKGQLRSRFACGPIWAAHAWRKRQRLERQEELLLVEWPLQSSDPVKYYLLWFQGEKKSLKEMARLAHGRWRVELDYRELKDELGLDDFEGRHWAGFHHHATLVSLAYGFLQWSRAGKSGRSSKRPHPYPAATAPPNATPPGPPHRLLPPLPALLPQLNLT